MVLVLCVMGFFCVFSMSVDFFEGKDYFCCMFIWFVWNL